MNSPDFKDARILIVDDNPTNVMLLEALLKKNGYTQVKGTTDPLETMPLYESFRPDLLLLDLQMPGLDGFGVLEQLQDITKEGDFLPVIVLTSEVAPEAKHRALSSGARDFVTKPFDHTEVLLRVRNLLEIKYLHAQLRSQKEAD